MDREALARLEPTAVDAFVRGTVDRVHSMMYGITRHEEEAEDLVQETYMRAFRSLPAYRGEAAPETWLYRIALNVGRDAIEKRQAARRREGGEVDPERHSAPDDPAADVVRREEVAAVREAVAALPEEWRNVVTLVDIEGMSLEEAGRTLDVPEGTVKSRLHRGREKLREALRKRFGGTP